MAKSLIVSFATLANGSVASQWLHVSALVFILLCCATLIPYLSMLVQRRSLPPGPFPLPIVGNCLQLPRSKPWLKYKSWRRQYSSGLITVWIGRTPNVVCNDAWSASELMDKRSSIYSSRPRYVVMGDVAGLSATNQVVLPYGERWRVQRKVMVRSRSPSNGFEANKAAHCSGITRYP